MGDKYVGDQNQTIFKYESGTFANVSGAAQWMGQVQSCEVDTELNKEATRFQGSATRNLGANETTIRDYTVSVTKNPQDWKSLYFALGDVSTSGAGPYTHTISELNNDDSNGVVTGNLLPSVTIENAKSIGKTGSNYIKTVNGCALNELNISSDGTSLITMDETWLGASLTPSSGTPSAVTAQTTKTWKACGFILEIPSGTQLNELKGWSLSVSNNMTPDHYSNGSCHATSFTAGDRDYTFDPVIDSNTQWSRQLYEQYFAGGSPFNCILRSVQSTGSQEIEITMSGCDLIDMSEPTETSGKVEDTLTIVPKSIHPKIIDSIEKYKLL